MLRPGVPWLQSFASGLARLARLIDRHPGYFLPLWIVAYWVVVAPAALRPLWYDELLTYYVATSPTLEQFIGGNLHVDLNPPLGYFPVRASLALLGDTPFAARLPSMIAFLLASLAIYAMARRRLGGGYALAAMGLSWSCGFLAYAVEARPYALLLAFFGLAAFCWLRAAGASRWTPAHWGLLTGIAGMLLSHGLAPFLVAAVGVGESVRTGVRKRIDRRTWLALVLPAPIVLLYIPLVTGAQALAYPPAFQPTAATMAMFYLLIVANLWLPLVLLIIPLLLLDRRRDAVRFSELVRSHEAAFGIATLLAPAAVILYFMQAQVPFWSRYGIGAALPVSLGLGVILAFKTDRSTSIGALAAVVVLVNFLFIGSHGLPSVPSPSATSTQYRSIRPDLPFVAASGLTFLEMDHYEPPEFVQRLYYLTDRESAIRHAHATIFEILPVLRRRFPVRAKVESYHTFVGLHGRFLVLATPGYPEDWLLAKLKDDRAEIRLLAKMKTSYKDGSLFEVTTRSKTP